MSQCNYNSNNSNTHAEFKGVPNNNYDDCPALMSDGRFITNYLPNCQMNNNVSKRLNSKPLSSWEYTYLLTNEAGKANNYFNNQYQQKYGCSAYPYKIIDPVLKQDCNTDNCVINNLNNGGMGMY